MTQQTLQVHKADPRFPIGRTRLETVGVVSCAVIMTLATIEVSNIENGACPRHLTLGRNRSIMGSSGTKDLRAYGSLSMSRFIRLA